MSGIFTINDYISDNSIQNNIKFTFTLYEYILLSNFIYIIYLSIYNLYIIYNIYMYICIYVNFKFFIYSNTSFL